MLKYILKKIVKKNKAPEYKSKRIWKFYFATLFIFLGFSLVLGKIFKLQVIDGDKYAAKAQKQHQAELILSAERGNIYDRNGKVLATTVKTLSVAVDPRVITDKSSLVKNLSQILGITEAELLKKINGSKKSFVKLARGVDYEKVSVLNAIKDKGLIVVPEPKRSLPYGNVAVQIIGITNYLNKGQSGLELLYDSLLNGKNGFLKSYRDALGNLRVSADHPIVPAIHGNSIQLSIDIDVQRIVEHELAAGMERSGAAAGTVIAIKPQTGEVLAMASYPTFDPNKIDKNSQDGMRNRGITDIYEPGSTFKMITASAAIQEGIINANTMVDGMGGVAKFKGYTIRDVHGIGRVTFRKAMEQSSNIVFSSVANSIEDNKFYAYLRNFGFGILTGIDFPGEVKGRVPKPSEYNGGSKRYMGHGYGLSTTALQMVNSYATVANNGVMMKPYFLKKIFNNKGEVIKYISPESIRRVITDTVARQVTDLLVSVVDSGSGKAARIQGIKVAGKTGTSQQIVDGAYSKQNYNASFCGFYPANDPQVAIIVVVDKPKYSIYGGANSAPIFRDICIRLMNMFPEYSKHRAEVEYSSNNLKINDVDSKKNTDSLEHIDSVLVPNLLGMQITDANEKANILSLKVASFSNEGYVFEQFPRGGTKVPIGTTIDVTLKNSANISKNSTQIDKSELSKTLQFKKHNVIGLPLRNAVAILQKEKIITKIRGHGTVFNQIWNVNKGGELACILECR